MFLQVSVFIYGKLCWLLAASINKGRSTRGVLETAERLANMSIGARKQSMEQPRAPPMKAGVNWSSPMKAGVSWSSPMKAGVNWSSESPNFMLRPAPQISTGRTYPRKVAGWEERPLYRDCPGLNYIYLGFARVMFTAKLELAVSIIIVYTVLWDKHVWADAYQ